METEIIQETDTEIEVGTEEITEIGTEIKVEIEGIVETIQEIEIEVEVEIGLIPREGRRNQQRSGSGQRYFDRNDFCNYCNRTGPCYT